MNHTAKTLLLTAVMAILALAARADTWIIDAANGCHIWNPHPVKGESIEWYGPLSTNYACGYGVAIWKINGHESERVAGTWKNGKIEGVAVWNSITGAQYAGEWKNGVKSGYGIYTFPDGSLFIGEFFADQPVIGRRINPDGKREDELETSRVRAAAYKAQDAAIAARKAAQQAAIHPATGT